MPYMVYHIVYVGLFHLYKNPMSGCRFKKTEMLFDILISTSSEIIIILRRRRKAPEFQDDDQSAHRGAVCISVPIANASAGASTGAGGGGIAAGGS